MQTLKNLLFVEEKGFILQKLISLLFLPPTRLRIDPNQQHNA